MDFFSPSQIVLFELLRASLFRVKPDLPIDIDWDAVLEEAKAQAVVALAAPQGRWKKYVDRNVAHNLRLLHEQKKLIELLEAHHISLVILKGTAVAVYYPEPMRRAMGDIDFLVPQDRFDEAAELMKSSGYMPEYGESEDSRHIGFQKNGITFELHHHFSSFRLDIEELLIDGLRNTETGVLYGYAFPMLSVIENGIVLLSHVRLHLLEDRYNLGLRQVIDWMMYVYCCLDEETWKEFRLVAQRYGLDTLAVTLTCACKKWLGLPSACGWCADADEALAEELLNTVMSSGNFSAKKKAEEKPVKTAMIKMRTYGTFSYLQEAGLVNWKAVKKVPVLRPFACGYQIYRYIRKGIVILLQGKNGNEIAEGYAQLAFLRRLGLTK